MKSEQQIIAGLKDGREQSYALLFTEYNKLLSVFAFKYIKDLDKAREIVQDLFVHIFENRSSIIITSTLKSYLFQSVKNRCINYLKHRQVEMKHLDLTVLDMEAQTDFQEKIEETELEYRIYRIVSELPARCREIFQMSRVEGMKNKQIAEQLNISIRTVETQISKALKKLRSVLGPDLK